MNKKQSFDIEELVKTENLLLPYVTQFLIKRKKQLIFKNHT